MKRTLLQRCSCRWCLISSGFNKKLGTISTGHIGRSSHHLTLLMHHWRVHPNLTRSLAYLCPQRASPGSRHTCTSVHTHTHTHVSHGRLRLSVRTGIMELFNGTTEQITLQKTGGVISSPGSPRGKRAIEAPSFLLRAPAQEPRLVLLATWKVKRGAQRGVSNSSGSHTRSLAPGPGGPQIAEARTGNGQLACVRSVGRQPGPRLLGGQKEGC